MLDDAPKLGANMSQTLTAAMVNDPLFGGKIVNSLTPVGEVGPLPRVLQVSGDDPATAKQEITQPLRSQGGDDLTR